MVCCDAMIPLRIEEVGCCMERECIPESGGLLEMHPLGHKESDIESTCAMTGRERRAGEEGLWGL